MLALVVPTCRQCAGLSQRPAGPFGGQQQSARPAGAQQWLTPAPTGYCGAGLRQRHRQEEQVEDRAVRSGPCGRSAGSRSHCRPTWRRLSVRCFRYSLSDFSHERRRSRAAVRFLNPCTRRSLRRPGSTQAAPESIFACGSKGSGSAIARPSLRPWPHSSPSSKPYPMDALANRTRVRLRPAGAVVAVSVAWSRKRVPLPHPL